MNDINKELLILENEKQILSDELEKKKKDIANMLLNGLGKDIDDVLSGKVMVKMSLFERIKYKIKFILNRINNII